MEYECYVAALDIIIEAFKCTEDKYLKYIKVEGGSIEGKRLLHLSYNKNPHIIIRDDLVILVGRKELNLNYMLMGVNNPHDLLSKIFMEDFNNLRREEQVIVAFINHIMFTLSNRNKRY